MGNWLSLPSRPLYSRALRSAVNITLRFMPLNDTATITATSNGRCCVPDHSCAGSVFLHTAMIISTKSIPTHFSFDSVLIPLTNFADKLDSNQTVVGGTLA